MSVAAKRTAITGWLWRFVLLLPLFAGAAAADKDDGKSVQVVQQRLTLASHMIQRMQGEKKMALNAELEGLQTRFLMSIDDALVADSDAFFRKVVTSYRAGNQAKSNEEENAHRRRYEEKLKEIDAFHQSYLELVTQRGDAARKMLDEEKYTARLDRARQLAQSHQYEEAYTLVDGANHQLITALQAMRNKETIEYRLEFATPAEEYEYEIRRFESQKMLLDMIVAEKQPNENSMEIIKTYVAEADSRRRTAQGLADAGDFVQAIDHQEQAVAELTKAMRVAGVYF